VRREEVAGGEGNCKRERRGVGAGTGAWEVRNSLGAGRGIFFNFFFLEFFLAGRRTGVCMVRRLGFTGKPGRRGW
jgi:hypothetical protein